MYSDDSRTALRVARHPLHAMLTPIPVVCFIGALATDIAYWRTAEMTWSNFSAWLLTAGLIFGVVAVLAGLVDYLSSPLLRGLRTAWLGLILDLIVLVVAFFNALVHTRDAWTSVVPTGLTLSGATVVLVIISGLVGGSLALHRNKEVA